MRALVIINPIAGPRRTRATGPRADLARRVLGRDIEVRVTEEPGHAETLARQAAAERCEVVFAWGGDGTINEVARALAFTDTALALVPAGSGNGLARALGVPLHPADALAHGASRPARRIDTGSLGGRFFVNVAGVGLDAEVAARFGRRGGKRGALPYVTIAVQAGLRYRACEYTIGLAEERAANSQQPTADSQQPTADASTRFARSGQGGECLTGRALIVALANSPQYGNGAIVAPRAALDDGLLDLVVVRDRSLVGRLTAAGHLFTRTLHRAGGVVMRQVTRVTIEAGAPLRFHADGDAFEGGQRLEGSVQAGALKIRA